MGFYEEMCGDKHCCRENDRQASANAVLQLNHFAHTPYRSGERLAQIIRSNIGKKRQMIDPT
jgi:hypothetical protein